MSTVNVFARLHTAVVYGYVAVDESKQFSPRLAALGARLYALVKVLSVRHDSVSESPGPTGKLVSYKYYHIHHAIVIRRHNHQNSYETIECVLTTQVTSYHHCHIAVAVAPAITVNLATYASLLLLSIGAGYC